MSSSQRSIRLLSKTTAELDRLTGLNGEVFYDKANNTLRIYDGIVAGGHEIMRSDFSNIAGIVSIAVSDTPPPATATGSLWFNSTTGGLFVYYKDGTSNQWMQPVIPVGVVGGGGGGGSSLLSGLTDVNISSVLDGQVLKYNASQSKWIPSADLTGSGGTGLTLTSFSVSTSAASGSGSLSYNNTSGVFTFTPPEGSSLPTQNVGTTNYVLTSNGTTANWLAPSLYTLPTAVAGTNITGTLGGVIPDGTTISITNGVISAVVNTYTLPTASDTQLGGVKVDNSSITISNGVISSNAIFPTASTSVLGGVRIDGSSITISGAGVISSVNSSGALSSRATVSTTTASLASTSNATATVITAKSYALISIQVSAGAWVAVYSSAAAQSADSSRSITTDPTPGNGVIAESISTTATTTYFSPAVIGYNGDSSVSASTYLKIYNNSGSTNAITVTLTYLRLEA
jgi:hypothetical protein